MGFESSCGLGFHIFNVRSNQGSGTWEEGLGLRIHDIKSWTGFEIRRQFEVSYLITYPNYFI